MLRKSGKRIIILFVFLLSFILFNYAYVVNASSNEIYTNTLTNVNSVSVTGVKLNKTSLSLEKGKTITLTAKISPSNATNQKVTWSSSDTSIAKVNSKGVVKGIKPGTVTITAKTVDGAKIAKCKVTVVIKVKSVKLNKTSLSLEKGKSTTLTAKISPSNATNQKVTWSSSDTSIAKVNSKGVVKGIKPGTVTITAKTVDGAKIAKCKVTVVIKVAGVTLDKTALTVGVNEYSDPLKAIIKPANATNQKVTFSSSDPTVAYAYQSGIVKGLKTGTAIITATTADGNKIATCKVTVVVKVAGLSLDKTTLSIKKGEYSAPIKAIVSPSNATNQKVIWESSDTNIVYVYQSGIVKGINLGTATITAKTADGNKIATCKVMVTNPILISKLHFVKAGDADSIIIESGGHYGLVDAAITGTETVNVLNKLGVQHLDFIVATHSHGDHIGGMANIASKFIDSNTSYYYRVPSNDGDSPSYYNTAIDAVKKSGAKLVEVTNKYPKFILGDFTIELMNTETAYDDEKIPSGVVAGANKDSIVTYLLYKGSVGTLLTGDMESQDEYRMVSKLANKSVDILKLGHHSWQSSTTMKFTKAIKPKIAIVTGKYLLDDVSTPVYYMQKMYGTKFYVTEKSDGYITIDYNNNLTVSPTKALVSDYNITLSQGHWRQLQNGIKFYLDDSNNLDSIVYDAWRQDSGKWYYMDIHGNMMTGWVETNHNGSPALFYFDKNGAMLTGWQQARGYGPYNNNIDTYYNSWMYSHVNGTINAWYQYSSTWANGRNRFYFDPVTGVMQKDKTIIIYGKSYTFDKDGICISYGC